MASNRSPLEADYESSSEDISTSDMESYRSQLETDYELSSDDISTSDMESYRSSLESDYESSSEDISTADMESYRSPLETYYELSSEEFSTADTESFGSPLESGYEIGSDDISTADMEYYRSTLESGNEFGLEDISTTDTTSHRSRAQTQDVRHPGVRMSSPFQPENNRKEIQRPDVRPAQSQGMLHPGVMMSSPFQQEHNRATSHRSRAQTQDVRHPGVRLSSPIQPEHNRKEIQRPDVRPAQSQGVLHPGVSCDGCGVNIRGIRNKCKTCKNYDLCSACKNKGFHREHSMLPIEKPQQKQDQDMKSLLSSLFQSERKRSEISQPARPAQSQGVLHPGITCDGCGVNIRGIRYKCSKCFDYDLCSECKGKCLHQKHPMVQINRPGERPAQPQGVPNQDISVLLASLFQPERKMSEISKPARPAQPQSVLHPGITCDGCGVNIRGIRYKCSKCFDYDLCSECKGKGLHQKHPMTEINRPGERPGQPQGVPHQDMSVLVSSLFQPERKRSEISQPARPAQSQGVLHPGIKCDGCGVNIRGIRYKCSKCFDYDLCSVCKGKGFHQKHPMTEIHRPGERPAQSQGALHQDMSLLVSSLFQPEHNRIEISRTCGRPVQSQGVLHPGVTCDGCGVNIRGIRYKCRICPDFDLCAACKDKGFHRTHPMVPITKPQQARSQDMGFLSSTLHIEQALQQFCSLAPSNMTASLHDQGRKVSSEKATTCGLCVQRKKGAVLAPCGHALCRVCAGAIAKSASKKCPFCRKKIQGIGINRC